MTSVCLQHWIEHPENLNKDSVDELRILLERYPYFQSLRLLYLKNLYLLHDARFGDELRKSVLYVADRRMLFRLIEGLPGNWVSDTLTTVRHNERTEEPGIDRTLSLIDAFLASAPKEQHTRSVELDYTVDYTAYLMRENEGTEIADNGEAPKLRGQELIDGFIRESERTDKPMGESTNPEKLQSESGKGGAEFKREPVADVPAEQQEELDDSYFTETLAKIYIKQHRYEKALEIIKKLSLNYPKKNAYFADQIRILEELIINAKSK